MRISPLLPALVLTGLGLEAATPLEGPVLPYRQAVLCAAVPGRLQDLKAVEGQKVKAGEVLATLDSRLEELDMQRAKTLLERREFEAKGSKRLYESRVIPEAKALDARIELDLARTAFEAASQQVKLRSVVASMDGVVALRLHEVGESVTPAEPLFRLLDLSRLWVVVEADPSQLGLLALGRKVKVQPLPAGEVLEGEVAFLAPEAGAEGRVRVKVRVDRPGSELKPGLRARVEP